MNKEYYSKNKKVGKLKRPWMVAFYDDKDSVESFEPWFISSTHLNIFCFHPQSKSNTNLIMRIG
jgi:hypothetical protein